MVADDIVFIKKTGARSLVVEPKQGMGSFLNIRGVGIIDVAKIYGAKFVIPQTSLDLMIELSNAGTANDYDLLGLDFNTTELLDIPVRHIVLPASAPSVLATKMELIVKNNSLSSPRR